LEVSMKKNLKFIISLVAALLIILSAVGCATKAVAVAPPPFDPAENINKIYAQEKLERDAFENILIYFDYNKSTLTDLGQSTLNNKSTWLRKHPGTMIVIMGHADERGSNSYNDKLGAARAQVVREYLRFLGHDASRMTIETYGKREPANLGHNEGAWKENRRVKTGVITMGPVQTQCKSNCSK
jgi:Outer membrane protein and related peptidoglycan-associated (lipo)proteins